MVPLDPELERTLRRIRNWKKEQSEFEQKSMENDEGCKEREEEDVQSKIGESVPHSTHPMVELERILRDYAFLSIGIPLMIRQPTI